MPIQFVDPNTGDFIPSAMAQTGCPSRYGIHTPEDLVSMSVLQASTAEVNDIFIGSQSAKL